MPRLGRIFGDEVVARCYECGDSDNATHGHLYINLKTYAFYCQKCGNKGVLPVHKQIEMLSQGWGSVSRNIFEEDDWGDGFGEPLDDGRIPELHKGPGISRPSLLDRYHVKYQRKVWDAFLMRTVNGVQTGKHLRYYKDSRMEGHRGFGYVGDNLRTSPDRPAILVEGPYDVVDSDHVSCYGLIVPNLLRKLRGHFVVLCPDGDVWQKPKLAARFVHMMDEVRSLQWFGATIVGIHLLSNGKDPDEVPPSQRIQICGDREIRDFLHDLKLASHGNLVA